MEFKTYPQLALISISRKQWKKIFGGASDEIITDYNTKAVNAYVDAYQRRDNNSDTAGKVDNETRQQMNNLLQRLCSVRFFLLSIACVQALLFGRAKRAARERAIEPRSRKGPPPAVASPLACLSRVYFSRYPPNGELARRLCCQESFSSYLQRAVFIFASDKPS